MKKLYIIIAILLTVSVNAQAPDQMSYQAVVRDASNALVTSQAIGMQISILKGNTNGEIVHLERQTPTTNINGLISIIIGVDNSAVAKANTKAANIATIDWGADVYFIKTEIDPTGGSNYTVTGTTQLLSVPYALYAKNSGDKVFSTTNNVTSNANDDIANDDFVFGSKELNGTEARIFFDKSKGAFRVGKVNGTEWDEVNIGTNSFATGNGTTASGNQSTAMGHSSKATGNYSTAMGFSTKASGYYSTTMGSGTSALGIYSTAMNLGTVAESYAQTSLGIFNTDVTGNATNIIATDRLFVIGNGTPTTRSDAMVVLKNGTIIAPSLDISEIIDEKVLVTKEYVDALRPKTYAIGDVALGGVVIWVDESGLHGLVCSLDNLSNGVAWLEGSSVIGSTLNYVNADGIGAGKLNTTMIVTQRTNVALFTDTNFAALLCATYSKTDDINGSGSVLYDDGAGTITISYADWYLPSIYELSVIYPNKELISSVCEANGGIGLSNGEFWSSNQYSASEAWVYFMSDNSPSPDTKSKNIAVRAFRSF